MNDSTIERVLLWMVSGLSGADLETACVAKLDVDPSLVKDVIAEARKRLTLAAEYNRDELLGTALTRLNDLYSRCIRAGADGMSKTPKTTLKAIANRIERFIGDCNCFFDKWPRLPVDDHRLLADEGEDLAKLLESLNENSLELLRFCDALRQGAWGDSDALKIWANLRLVLNQIALHLSHGKTTGVDDDTQPKSKSDSDVDRQMANKRKTIKWLAEAMTLVQQKPDWSDAAIARAVGVDPSRLSRSAVYKRAAKIARQRPAPPRGAKSKDGTIEAEDTSENE